MPNPITTSLVGLSGGLIAAFVMSLYMNTTKSLFGQERSTAEPATVQAANSVSEAMAGRTVPSADRKAAGGIVHYSTGAVFGVLYAMLAHYWPNTAIWFGMAFGIVMMLVFDDFLTPMFGWGSWPWKTSLGTHTYSLTAHMVFGAVLEGVRRVGSSILA